MRFCRNLTLIACSELRGRSLLHRLIPDVLTRVAYPELLQIPGDSVFAKVRRTESMEAVKAFEVKITGVADALGSSGLRQEGQSGESLEG